MSEDQSKQMSTVVKTEKPQIKNYKPDCRLIDELEAGELGWQDDFRSAYNSSVLHRIDGGQGKILDINNFEVFPHDLSGLDISSANMVYKPRGKGKQVSADMTGRKLHGTIIDEKLLRDTPHWGGADFRGALIRKGGLVLHPRESRDIIKSIVAEHGVINAKGLGGESNLMRNVAVASVVSTLFASAAAAYFYNENENNLPNDKIAKVCENSEAWENYDIEGLCKSFGFEMPEA